MITALTAIAAIGIYLVASGMQVVGLYRREPAPRPLLLALTGAAAIAHAFAVSGLLITPEGLNLGLFRVATLVALASVLLILALAISRPLENMLVVVMPLALLTLLGALLFDSAFEPIPAPDPGFAAHVILAILAYAVLAMAVGQALVTGWQERQLRQRRAAAVLGNMPPLQTMERVLFELLWVGLVLLTLAMGTGFYFLDNLFEQRVVHHTVLSMSSWMVFAVLLWGRYRLGWRGRTAIRWTLAGFVLLMLAYFGSKLVIEVILGA
ncbi:MAG: cytochrome c biogenesis protein CcsA [Gammaproteobacteria bacterium]|nr:cytochrome c biogenesis protein CcsA [Gammaproteobacteria bacterium]